MTHPKMVHLSQEYFGLLLVKIKTIDDVMESVELNPFIYFHCEWIADALAPLMWWPTNLAAVLLLVLLLSQPQPTFGSLKKQRREVALRAEHAAVATDDGRCSRVGRDVLREGGHAIDASVAAALCLGVVSPASSGIGGGGFMLIRSASNGMTQAFDMRETAPLLSSQVPF